MKTLFEIPTIGDTMTLPGGIALRASRDGEFVVHSFNTDRESGTSRAFFQGSYFTSGTPAKNLAGALAELARRAERATGYDRGGAIDVGKLLGYPEVAGLVDASGAFYMAQAMQDPEG